VAKHVDWKVVVTIVQFHNSDIIVLNIECR